MIRAAGVRYTDRVRVMKWRFAFAFGVIAIAACSLSLDGYTGGTDEKEAGAPPLPPPPADASDAPTDSGVVDAPTDATSNGCDDPGLVMRWKMDETSGAVVHDCTTNHLDGLFEGDAGNLGWTTRDGGGALAFTGDGLVELANVAPFAFTGSFTLAAFVRPDERPSGYAGFPWHYTSAGFEMTMAYDGTLYGQVGLEGTGGHVTTLFPTPQLGTWHHYAVVFERGVRLEVFVDGVSFGRVDTFDGGPLPDAGPSTTMAPLRVGPYLPGETWKGAVDDVRIYSRTLSGSELASLASR